MKNKYTHIPLLIFAIAILLVVVSLYGYMYMATGNSIDSAGKAIDFLANEQSNASKAKTLANLASSTLADRNKLKDFFVSSDNIVSFITTIESLGSQSGSTLSITSIDADSLTNATPGTTGNARAHISAHGSWGSVVKLLNFVEDMPYIVSVNHVRFDKGSADKKTASVWNLSFDLQASIMK